MVGQAKEEVEMTKINVYAVVEGVPRVLLTLEVEKEEAREMGSGYAAIAMGTDPRVSDAWWDYSLDQIEDVGEDDY